MHRTIAAGFLATSLLALAAAPAIAVDETKPTPCAGVLFADPTGDQERIPLAIGATPNMDITGVFITKKAGVTSANIVIADLDRSPPPTALGGMDWLLYFTVDDTPAYLRATTSGSDVSYEHGIDDPTNGLTPTGATPGAFFEGPDGVIQIELPETYADQELKNVWATSAMNQVAVVAYADSAPDAQEGPSVLPVACDAEAPAPAAVVKPAAGPTTLPVSLPATAGSARKASKVKRLRLKVDAEQPVTDLRLVLKDVKGKRTFASGRLSAAKGPETVTLTLKRKLRRGTYMLQASGVVDGKTLRLARKIRVSR